MLHGLSKPIANDVDRPTLLPDSILTARTQQDATRVEMLECDSRWRRAAEARVASLAKPPGSLGTLEAWYVTLCAAQETLEPAAGPACAIVFVGDHGLVRKDAALSPYPQSATQTMFKALAGGVSCTAVLARSVGASLVVVGESESERESRAARLHGPARASSVRDKPKSPPLVRIRPESAPCQSLGTAQLAACNTLAITA